MGSTELALILKFGVPLAVKLLSDGRDETETVEAVTGAIVNMESGDIELEETLLEADKEQTKSIIDGLFGVITGAAGALGGLLKAIIGLFGG